METSIIKNMRMVVRDHWPAIALAAVFGIVIAMPFFVYLNALENEYHGIFPQVANDDLFYWARIKDVMDGHPFLSNAYLAEYKDGPPQQLFLAEFLLAQPLKFFNMSVGEGQVMYNIILPALAFILTYAAFYAVFPSRLWAVVGTVFLSYGMFFSKFFRPVSPQFNHLFWLTQFILLYRVVTGNASRGVKLLAGLNFGLLFYIYPYYWTYYTIFLVIMTVVYFVKNRPLAVDILKIALGGALIGSFYFFYTYQASLLPYFEETMTRLQMIYTRFPSGIRIAMAGFPVAFAFLLFWWRGIIRMSNELIFFAVGIASAFIAVNQHIVTGRNFEFSSHYYMLSIYFFVFATAYLLRHLKNKPWMKFIPVVVLAATFILWSPELATYRKKMTLQPFSDHRQEYAAVFDWLNKNAEKDSVVYANGELSHFIPIYTQQNVFYARYANLFLMSDEEVLNRFMINNYYEEVDREFIIDKVRSIYGVRYVDQYGHALQSNKLRRLLRLPEKEAVFLPEYAITDALSHAEAVQSAPLESQLKAYRIDYMLWDTRFDEHWRLDDESFIETVFENERFVLYAVR